MAYNGKRTVVTPELFINGNFIREVERSESISGNREVILECLHCKKHFQRALNSAKRIQQKCCSHACYKKLVEVFDGGSEKHPLYPRWLSMRQRCLNPDSRNFKHYGARGIEIEEHFHNFPNYVNYVMGLPNSPAVFPTTSQIDRINNDGNYERGNLRWADSSLQVANSRTRAEGKFHSKYRGVSYSIFHNKWIGRVDWKGKTYCSSTHETEHEALNARNQAILKFNLPFAIQEP